MYTIKNIFFLFSNWYSGATLLTLLLDSHPEIVSNGEGFPFFPDNNYPICSCGNILQECDFYRYAGNHMWNGQCFNKYLFLREPYIKHHRFINKLAMSPRIHKYLRHYVMSLSKDYTKKIYEFSKAHLLFMERAKEFAGASIYLDATKSLRRAEILLSTTNEPIYAYLLVKDCRSFCYSALRIRKRDVNHAGIAAREWLKYIRFSKRLAKNYPNLNLQIIRYEDLCSSPLTILNDIYSDLGVSPRKEVYPENHTHHMLGNKMRMKFNGQVKFRDQWRTELDADTKRKIIRIAGDQMSELGYI